jgi:hypothetical protein
MRMRKSIFPGEVKKRPITNYKLKIREKEFRFQFFGICVAGCILLVVFPLLKC